jgi:hypothetical protein
MEEEKALPISKKNGDEDQVPFDDEPSIAKNILSPSKLPDRIHDVA